MILQSRFTLIKIGIDHLFSHKMFLFLKFVQIIMILIIWPIFIYPLASAQYSSTTAQAKPGCENMCGDVDIPYPFGMNHPKCYAHKWFEIECRNSTKKKVPYLKQMNLEDRNTFLAVGCNNIAILLSNGSQVGGCVSICDDSDDLDKFIAALEQGGIGDYGYHGYHGYLGYGYRPGMQHRTNCHGKYCCETSLPTHLAEYNATMENLISMNHAMRSSNQCSYVVIASLQSYYEYWNDGYAYQYDDSSIVREMKHLHHVPAVLEWEISKNMSINSTQLKGGRGNSSSYYCYTSNVTSSRSGWRCLCRDSFYGNPYIAGGCVENEYRETHKSRAKVIIKVIKWVLIGIFSILGSIIFALGFWRLFKVLRRIIINKRREMFFKRNGGLLLEQRLSSGEVNDDKVKLFNLRDLKKATDNFNVDRVLGKGGQGTVYKGMLVNGTIVAVKKFKVEGNVEEFINEFVILSQINHRNVVKLLGCCLETEIPLLVYEFIPNGNLYEYLHGQNDELSMTWDMRLRIAAEIAGALFYLHSAASHPIYHRDIKSTNILLDGKYKAKVADFGTSRMISIEATHLTTVVQGTFGYLDPEYFHTSQFTEKSDVYSFGVVLVELLTGQKPISLLRPQEAKSLAPYFVLCLEENRLLDIIDERIMEEGENQHIIAIANLASKCLELNGKKRPTMKEVAMELDGTRKLVEMNSNKQEHLMHLASLSIC
ncbi:wall-associated receptor kinase-like 18 isoform X2 [Lotus japonicus]|uniref:wall-associated receptor kinase-like 18 isoform X2 n=1 Tax=Lotus japonicus TaxID=34305 RepID=UPI00258D7B57|nr:wall-associated receptor kinase-like 18 isoform X2 [Lotus japonicus]